MNFFFFFESNFLGHRPSSVRKILHPITPCCLQCICTLDCGLFFIGGGGGGGALIVSFVGELFCLLGDGDLEASELDERERDLDFDELELESEELFNNNIKTLYQHDFYDFPIQFFIKLDLIYHHYLNYYTILSNHSRLIINIIP